MKNIINHFIYDIDKKFDKNLFKMRQNNIFKTNFIHNIANNNSKCHICKTIYNINDLKLKQICNMTRLADEIIMSKFICKKCLANNV